MPALRRPAEPRKAATQHSRSRHAGSSAWNAFCLEVSGDRNRSQSLDPGPYLGGDRATPTPSPAPPGGGAVRSGPSFLAAKEKRNKNKEIGKKEQRRKASARNRGIERQQQRHSGINNWRTYDVWRLAHSVAE